MRRALLVMGWLLGACGAPPSMAEEAYLEEQAKICFIKCTRGSLHYRRYAPTPEKVRQCKQKCGY